MPTRRRDAIGRLLNRHQVRESLTLAPQPGLRAGLVAGLQAALTALIALPLVAVSPWAHLIGFASLGSLIALFGRFSPRARRGRILLQCLFWQTFAVTSLSAAAWLGAPIWLQLALVALGCGIFFDVSTTRGFGPPGALIFVFAASASMGRLQDVSEVIERGAATLLVGMLAWVICLLTDFLRQRRDAAVESGAEPVRRLRERWFMAVRITVAAAIAAFAAHAGGAAYAGWAAMGSVAVMQGTHLHISMSRALQRMAGTVVGAILVWFVLLQAPPVWIIIGLIVGLMVATEVVIGTNYGLAQVLVTPMALLMTYLAAPLAADLRMVPERVMDTLIGAGIGMVMVVLWSKVEERLHLAEHHDARVRR